MLKLSAPGAPPWVRVGGIGSSGFHASPPGTPLQLPEIGLLVPPGP
jgi:hypothetical protein